MVNFSLTLVGFGNIDRVLQPMFTSKKTAEDLNVTEIKPSSVAYRSFNYRFISLQVVSLHIEVVSQQSLLINLENMQKRLSDVVADIKLGGS